MLYDVHIWAPGWKWHSFDFIFLEPCIHKFRRVFRIVVLLKENLAFLQALIMESTQKALLQDLGIFESIHGSINAQEATESKFRNTTPYHN